MTRKSRGEKVNKGLCCATFGWTRYQFDQNIAKGMPYVQAAAHRGDEWVVNTAEVAAWVEEQKRRWRAYVRRSEERTQAMLRAMEERQEAARRAERERVARWEAEARAGEGPACSTGPTGSARTWPEATTASRRAAPWCATSTPSSRAT